MKRALIVIAAVAAALLLAAAVYFGIHKHRAETLLQAHLQAQGYTDADIARTDVSFSVVRAAMSYNLWKIEVVFADEPNAVYLYSYDGSAVTQSGLTDIGAVKKQKTDYLHIEE